MSMPLSSTNKKQKHFETHPVHSIMSRGGSFPLHVATELIDRFSMPDSILLDPFCGKGTSLFAARLRGIPAYGLDIAPEAVICTQAKMLHITQDSITTYIKKLRFGIPSINKVPDFIHIFFHPSTLKQILGIRNKLFRDRESSSSFTRQHAIFCIALLLGILHGHASYSLSISSSHAYSMSPNYVAMYAAKHNLHPPERNVKDCLLQKAMRCLNIPLPSSVPHHVKIGTALNTANEFPQLYGNVDIILTSPPYLNAQTYAKDNWLRLWLLGYNYKDIRHNYIQTSSILTYANFMSHAFQQFCFMLKDNGLLICIAGDVCVNKHKSTKSEHSVFSTGKFLENLCFSDGLPLDSIERVTHSVPSNARYYHALHKSNGHSIRNFKETIFVAQKVNHK